MCHALSVYFDACQFFIFYLFIIYNSTVFLWVTGKQLSGVCTRKIIKYIFFSTIYHDIFILTQLLMEIYILTTFESILMGGLTGLSVLCLTACTFLRVWARKNFFFFLLNIYIYIFFIIFFFNFYFSPDGNVGLYLYKIQNCLAPIDYFLFLWFFTNFFSSFFLSNTTRSQPEINRRLTREKCNGEIKKNQWILETQIQLKWFIASKLFFLFFFSSTHFIHVLSFNN